MGLPTANDLARSDFDTRARKRYEFAILSEGVTDTQSGLSNWTFDKHQGLDMGFLEALINLSNEGWVICSVNIARDGSGKAYLQREVIR